MARDPVADYVINELCGGVKRFAEITGLKKQSCRNYLARGFPGQSTNRMIIQRLTVAGVRIAASDFFTINQPNQQGEDHGPQS